jgi:hypothetical protein
MIAAHLAQPRGRGRPVRLPSIADIMIFYAVEDERERLGAKSSVASAIKRLSENGLDVRALAAEMGMTIRKIPEQLRRHRRLKTRRPLAQRIVRTAYERARVYRISPRGVIICTLLDAQNS